jgi:hypothetical protein
MCLGTSDVDLFANRQNVVHLVPKADISSAAATCVAAHIIAEPAITQMMKNPEFESAIHTIKAGVRKGLASPEKL